MNDQFKKMLEDEDYRLIAAKILARTGDKAGIEPLREFYPEADELEKQRILRALMSLNAPELAPFYCTQCGAEMVTVRRLAQNCLVKLGKPAVPVILAMMESAQLVQKRMLIEALGRIGEVECILSLLDLLSDDDWRIRFSAVFGLERCADKLEAKHFMTLRAALVAEDNETVRQAIERLLDREYDA
ncbi:MAG: HEAT repeat domain-containing protein [Planctomycetota bacterium]|nr:HEAT repeat domain-containing protein [Planctomycetota bacterium]